jgi:DNA transformation protein and related proteins
MVAKSAAVHALQSHALELLAPLGPARARRMFGGVGLYIGEHFVALIANEVLYLKADASAQPAFRAAGSQPFGFATKDGLRTVLSYWSAPDGAMESAEQMRPWAALALDSALRAAAAKRTATPRKAQAKLRQARPVAAGRAATGKGRKAPT